MTPEELAWSFVSKVCELQCSERENCTCFNEIAQAIRSAEQARDERAAKIVEAECKRVLAQQKPDADPMSFDASVNLNLRMVTVLLPEIAAAIRAHDTPS